MRNHRSASMELANGQRFHPGDPGGSGGGQNPGINWRQGEYMGPTLPSYMDRNGTAGTLQYLRMQATTGSMPQDPFLLRISVEKHVGARIEGAFKESRGVSYVLKVRSVAQFNKLLRMEKLCDGTPVSISEHPQLNQRQCVVSNQDVIGLSDDYLKTQLAAQGIKDLRRIRRRLPDGSFINTSTIILTISGTVIPEHVDFGWTRCKTRNYYPSPMLCFHCWSFGHTSKRCTEPHRICGRCCKAHPEQQVATSTENGIKAPPTDGLPGENLGMNRFACTELVFCKNCKADDHAVSSRKCPIYLKEVEIQKLRIDNNISYPQARREFEARLTTSTSATSYSGVAAASKDAEIENLKAAMRQMQEDSKAKDVRMAEMEAALRSPSVGERLDKVREHGTIEQLIKQVADLTATVQKLQRTVEIKDQIISKLMTEKKCAAIPEAEDLPTVFSIADSQEEIPVSQDSMDFIPATAEQKLETKVQKWIDQTRSNSANNSLTPKAVENSATKKDKRLKKRGKSSIEEGTSTDESMSSVISQTSHHTNYTNNSTLNKRNHEGSDSSNDPGNALSMRRNNKSRKQEENKKGHSKK